jgi:hypothetical protein
LRDRVINLFTYELPGGKQSKEEILFELLVYNFQMVFTFSSGRRIQGNRTQLYIIEAEQCTGKSFVWLKTILKLPAWRHTHQDHWAQAAEDIINNTFRGEPL